MRQYVIEIVRQKWRFLSIILFLLLLNLALGIVVSNFQLPLLTELHAKWGNLRLQTVRAGKVDAMAVYQQGSADLNKLKTRIPEKRDFARILSDLFESAATSNVAVGTISYRPVQIKEEELLSYQLSLSVSGSYAAVKSFLSDLQNYQELIVVEPTAFSNSDLLEEKVVMNLNITVYLREGV